ncbi:hypothetical protein J437_LFUL014202 [Ladona fulva]|uniref:L-Fucosyltransferase n=1 Tax=Ladona fulva TaxID=123851 RepID=A0A8K0KIM5_LADFU|nr:hypothetical protein J437_LFUL014202 [Ladona fulva]
MKLAWRVLLGGLALAAIFVIGTYPFGRADKDEDLEETLVQPLVIASTERMSFDPLDTPMLRRFFQKYNAGLEVNPQPIVYSGNDPTYFDGVSTTTDKCTSKGLPIDDGGDYKAAEIHVRPAEEQLPLVPERENVISWQEFMDDIPDARFPSTKSSLRSGLRPVNDLIPTEPQEEEPQPTQKSTSPSSSSDISHSDGFEVNGTSPSGGDDIATRRESVGTATTHLPPRCRLEGVVTVQDGGRLGNKLWEYAAVWALGHALNMRPLVPSKLSNYLKRFFQDLSVGNLEDVLPRGCPTEPEAFGEPMKRWRLFPLETLKRRLNASTGGNLVLHRWIIVPEPVIALRGDPLKKEFRFHRRFVEEAQQTLRSVADEIQWKRRKQNCTMANFTFVGVHVRRTDFAQWLPRVYNKSLATATYFRRAMDYYRKQMDDPIVFIVVSDDPTWVKANLGARKINSYGFQHTGREDVYLGTKEDDNSFNGIGHDFALMSLCNHSIIDYGTFGAWGALLAGGNTISLESDQHLDDQFQDYIPGWTVWSDPGLAGDTKRTM